MVELPFSFVKLMKKVSETNFGPHRKAKVPCLLQEPWTLGLLKKITWERSLSLVQEAMASSWLPFPGRYMWAQSEAAEVFTQYRRATGYVIAGKARISFCCRSMNRKVQETNGQWLEHSSQVTGRNLSKRNHVWAELLVQLIWLFIFTLYPG